ncbi:Nodule Cysteine-Rich (NCR) secreted peptide [Medicago truncatula]|uniref:Nodule Cysteine-Rich (NCR) secreted peptide n=1 Tax=Medicago truncatula TaxID=3880 RepID=G7KUV1_MEDTR|nr:Nodule Cysteine-Rich (NCR) secreted peptide [Medicago truncatula]
MFVYNMILFVSLFLVVVDGEKECACVADCIYKYPTLRDLVVKCIEGYCKAILYRKGWVGGVQD